VHGPAVAGSHDVSERQVCLAAVAAFRKSESHVRFAFRLVMMDNTVCSVFESNTPDREEVGRES
jgi:hypothetical protein